MAYAATAARGGCRSDGNQRKSGNSGVASSSEAA